MLKLTDRDVEFLRFLGRCGVMRVDQVRMFYPGVSRYHLRRVEVLSKAGLIVREHGYVRATAAELRAAGFDGVPYNVRKWQYREQSLAVELISQFPEWRVDFGYEYKRRNLIHRSSLVSAFLSREGLVYGVYFLVSVPRRSTVTFLLASMHDLVVNEVTDRVLVFALSPEAVQVFGQDPPAGVRECCLLPYPGGIAVFRRLYDPAFHAFLRERFPGLAKSDRPFAHYEFRDAFVTVLFHNDLAKRAALESYLKSAREREGRRCVVVCSPVQALIYRSLPGVEVVEYDPCGPCAGVPEASQV